MTLTSEAPNRLAQQSGPSPTTVRRMQVVDLARSIPLGVLMPLEQSVLLTIALKRFDAPGPVKGLIAAAGGFGLLLSPFVTSLARRTHRPAMVVASVLSTIGAFGFVLAASGSLATLTIGAIVGLASMNAIVPLMTVTYQRNFPTSERGKRVGWGLAVKVAVAAVVALLMGSLLKRHLNSWWLVVLCGAFASVVMAFLQLQMPSDSLDHVEGRRNRPWPHFDLLKSDRQLSLTLGAWMLMGFGNLMLLPLRVEYLAQPKYGIVADAGKITLLTVAIPSVVRLLTMPLFGAVFDRMSFFAARIVVNLFFAVYIAAFFTGTSDAGLVFGAVALGVGSAGGDLMWSLWVTKFAPSDRVADYMGLHTFFTGVRAVGAPMLAFAVITKLPLGTVAVIAALLMVAASLVLVPEARAERARRRNGPAAAR